MDLSAAERGPPSSKWSSYAWAPSERAMKGRYDQSLAVAGSSPSSTPNQLSISGPLTSSESHSRMYTKGLYLA